MQVKEQFDIIIIGAGASGLFAAVELTRVKLKILILEAEPRIGGRMYTNVPENFTDYIESGAEFIHGEAPLTLEILKEAEVEYVEMSGNIYQAHEDHIDKEDFFDEEWRLVLEQLAKLKVDMAMSDFLSTTFPESKYNPLKEKVTKFVEGYNAADIQKASSISLRDEWSEEEDPAQYRIVGGYQKLYNFLYEKVVAEGGEVKLSHKVEEIKWSNELVEVKTDHGIFYSRKTLVTIPVSLLKRERIKFQPAVPQIVSASANIGFGGVIKINIEFKNPFWETQTKRKFSDLQFLFTDESIPTWWSQSPNKRPLLTGWLGGPRTEQVQKTDEEIFNLALSALSTAFDYPATKIKDEIIAYHVDQWVSREFSLGAYSYEMVGSKEAIKILEMPISSKLFFAGEAIYTGPHKGTVEAALTSGKVAVQRILETEKFISVKPR